MYSKCENCERDSAEVKQHTDSVFDKSGDEEIIGDVNSFTATPVHKKEPSGCKLPGERLLSMINMMEKVPTRVNIMTPFANF